MARVFNKAGLSVVVIFHLLVAALNIFNERSSMAPQGWGALSVETGGGEPKVRGCPGVGRLG